LATAKFHSKRVALPWSAGTRGWGRSERGDKAGARHPGRAGSSRGEAGRGSWEMLPCSAGQLWLPMVRPGGFASVPGCLSCQEEPGSALCCSWQQISPSKTDVSNLTVSKALSMFPRDSRVRWSNPDFQQGKMWELWGWYPDHPALRVRHLGRVPQKCWSSSGRHL